MHGSQTWSKSIPLISSFSGLDTELTFALYLGAQTNWCIC